MKFRSILHSLQQMSDEELDREAQLYIPMYMRAFQVRAFAPAHDEPVSESNPLYFIASKDAKT